MTRTAENRVRVTCGAKGYEDFWIEYDSTPWTLATYVELHGNTKSVYDVLTEFIPEHSTDWLIRRTSGVLIPYPGHHASEEQWKAVWAQFDAQMSRGIFSWLWMSAVRAMNEAMTLPFRGEGDDTGGGAGLGDAAGRQDESGGAVES